MFLRNYATFDYVIVQGFDLTGLRIAEEYRAAIEQRQIAEQLLLRAQTEVKFAEQEAKHYRPSTPALTTRCSASCSSRKRMARSRWFRFLPGAGEAGGLSGILNGRR